MIIINADDFGYSKSVNEAIVRCFRSGLISSTTIMANMSGFQDACRWAVSLGLIDRIGIHLNFTEGDPLTDAIRDSQTFCDRNGQFLRRRHFRLSQSDARLLAGEAAAQIQRCRSAGLPLTHADSHQHAHTEPGKFQAIQPVLRGYGIPRLRIARNVDQAWSMRGIYKSLFNRQLAHVGWRQTDYFGDIASLCAIQEAHATVEVAVHPGLNDDDQVIDLLDGQPLEARLRDIVRGRRLVGYATSNAAA